MPSFWDNTYHWEYSKPTYDSENDEIKQKAQREADYIFEPAPPREPNR